MGDQLVSNGTYTVMGPGGMLTDGDGAIVLLEPRKDKNQQWEVKFDSGTYILRNMASGAYLGNDGDPNEIAMQVKGSRQPYTWKLLTRVAARSLNPAPPPRHGGGALAEYHYGLSPSARPGWHKLALAYRVRTVGC